MDPGLPPESPLWRPSPERVSSTALSAFRSALTAPTGSPLDTYRGLHRWSVEEPEAFWRELWDFTGVIGARGTAVLERVPEAVRGARWFPEARLSFTENLLRGEDSRPALISVSEEGPRRELSLGHLRREVGTWTRALGAAGIGPGDRVAGWLTNGPEAVIAMLACANLGALWSSCSPDFGPQGVLDRFQQIEPKLLIAVDGHLYRGKRFDDRPRLAEVVLGLPSLETVVVVPWLDLGAPDGAIDARRFLEGHPEGPTEAPEYARHPFEQPLYVMFSSGTTGRPKCIVHGAGGTLLQHLKEHRLQCDMRPGERVFFYTSLGWMMWNWLVSALASETTVVLYDGDPLRPADGLLALAARERLSFFGVSAKYVDVLRKESVRPPEPLATLRTVATTGSPLAPEAFDWIYDNLGPDLHLASISGGTDILSCFVGGDPTGPVWRGEIQAPGLGMDVDVVDPEGRPEPSAPGELVCRPPFPSMPLGFWNDPDGRAFRRAYFERFPGLWHHGDFAHWTEHGGMVILGRSDSTLNVHGVRIGTAEIYRELEAFGEVREAVAVEYGEGESEGIAVLLVLRPDAELDAELQGRIRTRLRERMSPRHVPRYLARVADLPRTRSGKLSEKAVGEILHGREPTNVQALANPETLEALRRLEL